MDKNKMRYEKLEVMPALKSRRRCINRFRTESDLGLHMVRKLSAVRSCM